MAIFTLKNSIKFLLITAVLVFGIFQITLIMAQTPLQPYRLVKKVGEIEIRFYPPAVEASVLKTGDYRQVMNNGFRDLAGYIFGGNEEKQKIAMTAPVKSSLETSNADSLRVAFVMPEGFDMDNKPTPYSKNIVFQKTKEIYTASLTFGGFASRSKMEKKAILLQEMLKKENMLSSGKVDFLYYNPPFQLFGRRNEVLVELTNFSE